MDSSALLAPDAQSDEWLSATMRDPEFIARARSTLTTAKRIHIANALATPAAERLYRALLEAEWSAIFNGAQSAHQITSNQIGAINPRQQEQALQDIHARACGGFQFLYDCYHITQRIEAGAEPPGPLSDFVAALNAPDTLEILRSLTGDPRIVSVNAQATRYRPGHFLTEHDDDIAGRDRLFAYVFNFTPAWRADWGGLLNFIGKDGHVQEAYTPAWNALNIFPVGQPHAVSFVAPFAGAFRYSITGWMRAAR